ncbi:MFS transporter [Companilactobacillus suantsaicola]|uniref:MFS transporter n=1 Tax=Companilactobacillus suantsaicola TaxID=2487723 RepID=UPI001436BB97|nr:MFS transporter [Companilactobacillus suantsaicola]
MFFITALISLINAKEYAAYAIGMVILTLGEMLVNPAIPALVSETTPRNESGCYQSLVSMTGNFAKAIGPFLGGVLIENSSYNVLFLSAIMLLILSLGIFRVARKRLVAERI